MQNRQRNKRIRILNRQIARTSSQERKGLIDPRECRAITSRLKADMAEARRYDYLNVSPF